MDFDILNNIYLAEDMFLLPKLNLHLVRLCSKAGSEAKIYIGDLVKKSKVVVFMKGNPEQPRCGFSNAVVQILKMHGVKFDAHNILEDENLRNDIKVYSNWPTIPQVFINGEFVGGCDILMQMHRNGDLIEELKKVGIESELLKAEQTKDNSPEK